jgi:hypothetical protein
MAYLLNQTQRNSLANVLRMFEESLHQAEAWLEGAEEGQIIYHRKLYLGEEKRRKARQKIAQALAEISAMAERFELNMQQENASSLVYSQFIHLRADLIDTTSDKLRRFGTVDARLTEVLDPAIKRLFDIAMEIASAFNE